MNTINKKDVELQIIQNPKLNINDVVGATFERPQQFGGISRSVTVKRKNLARYIDSNKIDVNTLAKQIGVTPTKLKGFVQGKKLGLKQAVTISNFLDENINAIVDELKDVKVKATKAKDVETQSFNGSEKQLIRENFINHIDKSKLKKGKFFTLPSDGCDFETQLNGLVSNDFHYIACERLVQTFHKLVKTIAQRSLLMSANFGETTELTSIAKPDTFSHMFLDYCGTFPLNENEVRNVIYNNLVKVEGYIGLTFCARESNKLQQKSIDFHRSVLRDLNSDVKASTGGGIKLKIQSMLGNSYKLIEFIPYKDDTAMFFVLIKRVA